LDCAVRTVSFDFGFGILCCVLMGWGLYYLGSKLFDS
jgi:hypothetical protein